MYKDLRISDFSVKLPEDLEHTGTRQEYDREAEVLQKLRTPWEWGIPLVSDKQSVSRPYNTAFKT